jgi:hypothetical protein
MRSKRPFCSSNDLANHRPAKASLIAY